MIFRITSNAFGYQWYMSIWLVDGKHRQEFVVNGEYDGDKLESFIEARKNMKYLLKEIQRTIEYGSMTEIIREATGDHGEVRKVKLTSNWQIE